MQPSNHLIITFQEDGRAEKKVRMAHTMIAQYCTELLADEGVTRSDTTRNFLNNFCSDEIPLWLFGFVKDMLTKREMKKEEQEKFSRLILDIEKMEGNEQCATVLEEASYTFDQNPNFPQTLARFYYIEQESYNPAEMWAKTAIERDPQNSFVADTLGQVHKNHLMKQKVSGEPREILHLAEKAIKAFENEEKLAENEVQEMREHGNANISQFYNYRGLFGYLRVCNTLYDKLVRPSKIWKNVLTKKVSKSSALKSLEDNELLEFRDYIKRLRDEAKKKLIFFENFLAYSKTNMEKDDPEYIFDDTSECYQKYVGDTTAKQLIEMFKKRNLDDQSVEVLSFLVKEYTQTELEEISMCPSADSETALVNNILARFERKMPLSDRDPPELHMFALLWYWPENQGQCVFDLSELTQKMHKSYENSYKKYFRARYHLPLFFIGKGEGVKRIVHRNVIEKHLEVRPDWSDNWKKEEIFRNSAVQELLLRLNGEVRNYKVYTRVVCVRNSLWKPRSVTFYLGFTIRGPVAFDIQKEDTDESVVDNCGTTQTNDVKETKDNEGH
ncbi:sterile alpha motif domain-containing protein 9-like [Oreochromis aureus]|uniref:sterile alpha motif domain-containing protein 9-like n=1 Tax=Oreochromis aureus TaxID=47969 RepID=UPI0019534B80|nr:sterile alpha motif domain-containing protein 9-like [Oreochromis aureus]